MGSQENNTTEPDWLNFLESPHISVNDDLGLLSAFNRFLGERYKIDRKLGSGVSGVVYLGKDAMRNIDVAIKLYRIDNLRYVRRHWCLTSTFKDLHLNDTYTVETYHDNSGMRRLACISRYVVGKSLGEFVCGIRNLPNEEQKSVRGVLLRDVGVELCTALQWCHQNGFGHGDLHNKNVMVSTPQRRGAQNKVDVILIDLDNASYQPEDSLDEDSLIRSDVDSLKTNLLSLVWESQWNAILRRHINECIDVHQVQNAYEDFLKIFEQSVAIRSTETSTPDSWVDQVKSLMRMDILTGKRSALWDALKLLAMESDQLQNLQEVIKSMEVEKNENLGEFFSWGIGSVTVEISSATRILKALLEEKSHESDTDVADRSYRRDATASGNPGVN